MQTTMNHDTTADPRWTSLATRDRAAEGTFFYAVTTTGIYCRPSCAARRPRPENVRFFASGAEAEVAGFRPCQRCKPDQPPAAETAAAKVAAACRRIETAEEVLSLAQLSKAAGLSPFHFHRVFKSVTGVTPKAYAAAHRAKRVRQELGRSRTVTEAIYDAGYNSGGRFYAEAQRTLGMTPTALRAAGAGEQIRFAVGTCSLGAVLVAASARGICAIALGDTPEALTRDLERRFSAANLIPGDAAFARQVAEVVAFVEAPGRGLSLPLDIRGSVFQQRVWQALLDIPAGATASYAEIAAKLGVPKAARAVAGACAANTLAVAVPCHRVVGKTGALSGYRWGVARKRRLLDREAACAG